MKLIYIGKKAPLNVKMPWLTKEYTFDAEPVEVEPSDGHRLLKDNPMSFKLVGLAEPVFPGSEDDEPLMIGDEQESWDAVDDGLFPDEGNGAFVCENCGRECKSKVGLMAHARACKHE